MKTFLQTFLILMIFSSMISCDENRKGSKKIENYSITASISGFQDGTKFFLKNLATDADIDSAKIEDGKFQMTGHLNNPPEQLWLTTTVNENFLYTNLLIGNDSISIKGNIKDFPWNVIIEGSEIQAEYSKARNETKKYYIERETLVNYFMRLDAEKQQQQGKAIWQKIAKIDSITFHKRVNYLKNNNSYTSIIDLGYLKKELPKDSVEDIYNRYSDRIKNSKYGEVIKVYLNSNIRNIGDSLYDFEGLNQHNQKISLSNIQDSSKLTLIDFTSANCGACIQAADELASVNKIYKDSLMVVSFSGDPKKKSWLRGIKRDNVSWNSIWDGKGRFSKTAITYGISGFPTFILINRNGVIIDKWTGYSKDSLISRIKQNIEK